MNLDEKRALAEALLGTAEALGHEISVNALALFVGDLEGYSFPKVLGALTIVRKEAKGRMTISAILEKLDPGQGFLAGNEAWALSQAAADERNAVVWTKEMQSAWHGAEPLYMGGDKIGARMAFLEAYARLSTASRTAGERPYAFLTRGYDASTTAGAIDRARLAGLLAPEEADRLRKLGGVAVGRLEGNGDGIAGAIAGAVQNMDQSQLTEEQRTILRNLPRELIEAGEARDRARLEQAEKERRDLEALKKRELKKLKKAK